MQLTRNEKITVGVLLTGSALAGAAWLGINAVFLAAARNVTFSEAAWDADLILDIEDAMPPVDDFPGGWVVADEGADYVPDKGRFAWRVLRLQQPTQVEYIAVYAAPDQNGIAKKGWTAHQTSTQAYAEIERLRAQVL
jgi:hypothetical protein